MKKMFILAAAAVVTMTTGCSKDQTADVHVDNAIDFRVNLDKGTRATEATSISAFKVYAYWDELGGTQASSSMIPNFMYNVDVTKPSGSWTYSPTKYWPTTGKVHFYAYSPSSYATFATASGTAGLPRLTYTVQDTPGTQEDFLVAKMEGQVKTASAVTMTFRHALSQIVFKAKSNVEGVKFTVSSIELTTVYPTGTIDLRSAGATDTPVWTGQTGTAKNYTASLLPTASQSITYTGTMFDLTGTDGTLMIMPQQLTGGPAATYTPASGSYLRVTYSATDESTGAELVANAVIFKPLTLNLEGNKKYTIELGMNGNSGNGGTNELGAIEFDATVSSWDPASPSTTITL